ncbi:relaxase/mobilization nuclease domain-containing protein [Arachidicoccus sp.]|uniref:relaxase/mobilization nuclease domain-containing protein n=1 Tax=Arachidicoccus sp. TaxID=1872624 RepID=UPI003D1C0C02
MISKIFKSSGSFKDVLNYLTQKEKNHEMILSNGVRDYSKRTILNDFIMQAKMNPRIKKMALHMVLSHHPGDEAKIKGKEKEIISMYFEKLKEKGIDFYATQFIVCRHNDQEHIHYHILANYVADDFKRFPDNHIGLKSKKISQEITKEYKLTLAQKLILEEDISQEHKIRHYEQKRIAASR